MKIKALKKEILAALTAAIGMALSVSSNAACVPSAPKFMNSVAGLKAAIRDQNPDAVLKLIGEDGLAATEAFNPKEQVLGATGFSLERPKIEIAFALKVKAYCHFFSCEGQPALLSGIVDGQTLRNEITGHGGQYHGLVRIEPTSGKAKSIDLMFELSKSCKWGLTFVVYNFYDAPS